MFSDTLLKSVARTKFRHAHIIKYTIIGVFSILCELLARTYLIITGFSSLSSDLSSILISISIAFYLNYRFNFSLPKRKLRVALLYFILISLFSYGLQKYLATIVLIGQRGYYIDRLAMSGILYVFIYFLHRRFTFKKYRQVGVAVYANGVEDILDIKSKIGVYSDFIHVDIVDSTILGELSDVRSYRLETIKAAWPNIPIHTHIMSKTPSVWLKEVCKSSDIVFVHDDIEEDLFEIQSKIKSFGCEPGLALHANNRYAALKDMLNGIHHVMVLTIQNPGFSGQRFMPQAYELIKELNHYKSKLDLDFSLCIDGGVNIATINSFDSDQIVSGSCVLDAPDPKKRILELQNTSDSIGKPLNAN